MGVDGGGGGSALRHSDGYDLRDCGNENTVILRSMIKLPAAPAYPFENLHFRGGSFPREKNAAPRGRQGNQW